MLSSVAGAALWACSCGIVDWINGLSSKGLSVFGYWLGGARDNWDIRCLMHSQLLGLGSAVNLEVSNASDRDQYQKAEPGKF